MSVRDSSEFPMFNGLYISNLAKSVQGYDSKLTSQVKAINDSCGLSLKLIQKPILSKKLRNNRVVGALVSIQHLYNACLAFSRLKSNNFTLIYIRIAPRDFIFLLLLLYLRLNNVITRKYGFLAIVPEIPTIPFETSYRVHNQFLGGLRLYLDKAVGFITAPLVTFYSVCGNSISKISGAKAINFDNGLNIHEFNLKMVNPEQYPSPLRFIWAGNCHPDHGVDLFLDFLYKRCQCHEISIDDFSITLVGPVNDLLSTILSKYQSFSKSINCTGPIAENDFLQLCHNQHLGIGNLASYRIGSILNSPLKHRSYASIGLPFIYDGCDKVFQGQQFSIDLNSISTFSELKQFYAICNDAEMISNFQKFSVEKLSWKSSFSNVTSYINQLNKSSIVK